MTAVHIQTVQEYYAMMEHLRSNGYKWRNGKDPFDNHISHYLIEKWITIYIPWFYYNDYKFPSASSIPFKKYMDSQPNNKASVAHSPSLLSNNTLAMNTKDAIDILKQYRGNKWYMDTPVIEAIDVLIRNYPNNDILVQIHDSIPDPSTYCNLWRSDLENKLAYVKWALYSYWHIYAK